MKVQELIAKWYSIATGGDVGVRDVFFNFVAIWIAFNALYALRHSKAGRDRDQVRSFAEEPKAMERHGMLLREDVEYQKAVRVLKHCGVYNMQTKRHLEIRNEKNLREVTECVYQVRCNLFHGGKMPENARDEGLIEASYKVVSRLIEPYL